MPKYTKLFCLLLASMLLLSACNMPAAGGSTPTNDANTVQTAAAQTVQALQTQIAGTQVPTQALPTLAPVNTVVPPTAVIM